MRLSLKEKQTLINILESELFRHGNCQECSDEKEVQRILSIISKIENSIKPK